MKTFLQWLNEAKEMDLFDLHPDTDEPEGGSSHSIYRLKSKEGEDFWSKSAASNLQTINEYLAWKLYKLFDIRVASKSQLVMGRNGKIRLVSSQVSGKQFPLNYGSDVSSLEHSDISKGFFVDAFIGHWDVVGNEPRSNLFVDDEKRVTRIDLGGLDFRATGPRKSKTIPGSWGPEVGELQTMGGIGGSPMRTHASSIFTKLKNNPEKLLEAAATFKRINWNQIEQVLNEVILEVKELSEEHNVPEIFKETYDYIIEIKDVLRSRFEDLHKKIKNLGL